MLIPSVLPVFPLTGSLLLPGNWLPLNIFEPRYRNMVADALEGERFIGMIQPLIPRQDNRPDLSVEPDQPDLYQVGCAGHIEKAERTPDGRYRIVLQGVTRFRVVRELALKDGYRRVEASYEEFAEDPTEPLQTLDPAPLLSALQAFAEHHGLEFPMERLQRMPGVALLNGLAVALPFSAGEKQALLEAEGLAERHEMLLSLMGMGIGMEAIGEEAYDSPPTIH